MLTRVQTAREEAKCAADFDYGAALRAQPALLQRPPHGCRPCSGACRVADDAAAYVWDPMPLHPDHACRTLAGQRAVACPRSLPCVRLEPAPSSSQAEPGKGRHGRAAHERRAPGRAQWCSTATASWTRRSRSWRRSSWRRSCACRAWASRSAGDRPPRARAPWAAGRSRPARARPARFRAWRLGARVPPPCFISLFPRAPRACLRVLRPPAPCILCCSQQDRASL
jgi:hypothetical protein